MQLARSIYVLGLSDQLVKLVDRVGGEVTDLQKQQLQAWAYLSKRNYISLELLLTSIPESDRGRFLDSLPLAGRIIGCRSWQVLCYWMPDLERLKHWSLPLLREFCEGRKRAGLYELKLLAAERDDLEAYYLLAAFLSADEDMDDQMQVLKDILNRAPSHGEAACLMLETLLNKKMPLREIEKVVPISAAQWHSRFARIYHTELVKDFRLVEASLSIRRTYRRRSHLRDTLNCLDTNIHG